MGTFWQHFWDFWCFFRKLYYKPRNLRKFWESFLKFFYFGVRLDLHNPILLYQKKLRRQAKAIFVWYPKLRGDHKAIHDENNVLTDDELVVVRDLLKRSKFGCLYLRNEYARGFKLLNHICGDYF